MTGGLRAAALAFLACSACVSGTTKSKHGQHPGALEATGAAAALLEPLIRNGHCEEHLLGANFPSHLSKAFTSTMAKGGLELFEDIGDTRNHLRQCLYLKRQAQVAKMNSRPGTKATFEVNHLSVLVDSEFHAMYAGLQGTPPGNDKVSDRSNGTADSPNTAASSLTAAAPPTNFTWVGTAIPKDAENQHQCGGCWAFAASQTMMALNWIQHGNQSSSPPQQLSAQQLISCASTPGRNQGCQGGNYAWVWEDDSSFIGYSVNNPLLTSSQVPFDTSQAASSVSCSSLSWPNGTVEGVVASGLVVVGGSAGATKDEMVAALQKTPVAISINANAQCFQGYTKGTVTFDDCTGDDICGQVDHAVVVVGYRGYGTDDFAFQIKNSWGNDWGEDGYIWISPDVAVGTCETGLLQMLSFPAHPRIAAPQAASFPPAGDHDHHHDGGLASGQVAAVLLVQIVISLTIMLQ